MTRAVTATFLFTDLVDSTAIAQRLGPEAAEELRTRHFALLRRAITAADGIEVKNLGDGLMTVFTSPSQSIAGAIAIQQAIDHFNHGAVQPLGVRIGIGVGEVVEDDGDYFGDAVVEAARLCASAESGQILATDAVRVLAGRHGGANLVAIGDLELKGILDPVPVVEVRWEPTSAVGSSVAMPARLNRTATDALFGFCGRDTPLETLLEAGKRSVAERRVEVVLVSGEAGIGKSTVVAHAAHVAHDNGATVLYGHCDEDFGAPYQPWIEALTHLVEQDPRVADELALPQRTALGRLIPSVVQSGGSVSADPDSERLVLMDGVVDLLAAASASAPLVVILDDIHWADVASLQLLRRIVIAVAEMPVLVVCTYRDTDLSAGSPLSPVLADFRREPRVTRLALTGLGDDEVAKLMATAAGHDLDDDGIRLAHAVRRETGGNPFFAAELLRHLSETGAIVQGADGRWSLEGDLADLGLPNSVREVVSRRVERLGPDAVRVLSLASVIGRDFDVELLEVVAEIDGDALLDLMDAATTAALVTETERPERYRFVHALMQHTLYSDLSPLRRQRAHLRVGEALEAVTSATDLRLEELAHHWLAATRPSDAAKALRYAELAGDAALAALAPDDAIRWYQSAIDLAVHERDELCRARLLVGLGTAQFHAGLAEHRETMLEAGSVAERLGDADLLVAALLGGTGVITMGDGDPEQLALAQRALEAVGPEPSARRARVLVALIYCTAATEYDTRQHFAAEAIEVAMASGDDATIASISSVAQIARPPLDEWDDINAASIAAADRTGQLTLRAAARRFYMDQAIVRGDIAEARRRLAEHEVLADQTGLSRDQFYLARDTAVLALLAGDLAGAEVAMERALVAGTEIGQSEALPQYGGQLYELRRHQGRQQEIADFFEAAAAEHSNLPVLSAAIANLKLDAGDVAAARAILRSMFSESSDPGPLDNTRPLWLLNCADAVAQTGEREIAAVLRPVLEPYSGQIVAPGAVVIGAVDRPLGLLDRVLGDTDQAESRLRAALALHERLDAPYFVALTQLDLAELLIERNGPGDGEEVLELLRAASSTAEAFGYGGLERRVRDVRPR